MDNCPHLDGERLPRWTSHSWNPRFVAGLGQSCISVPSAKGKGTDTNKGSNARLPTCFQLPPSPRQESMCFSRGNFKVPVFNGSISCTSSLDNCSTFPTAQWPAAKIPQGQSPLEHKASKPCSFRTGAGWKHSSEGHLNFVFMDHSFFFLSFFFLPFSSSFILPP